MNTIKRKITIICVLVGCLLMGFNVKPLKAASIIVYPSADVVYVGDVVAFTVVASNGAGNVTVSGAVSDYDWFDNSAKSYYVTAETVGTITVEVSAVLGDYSTEKDVSCYDYATVTVIERPAPVINEVVETILSSDSSLSSLTISQGELSPAFKASTTSYKVALDKEAASITLKAKANDANAYVEGTGEKKLKAGNNTFKINCVAEDGSKTTYTIQVYVDEEPLVYVDYQGNSLGVVRNTNEVTLANKAFTKTSQEVDGHTIDVWKSIAQGLSLVYLQNEDSSDFYIYDEEKNAATSIYRPMALLGKNIIMIDVPEELQTRDGMTYTTVTIDGKQMPGWTFDDKAFENYALIYVMDETGNTHYYQYEASEKTLQLYSSAPAISAENYKKEIDEKDDMIQKLMYGCIGLGAAAILLLLLTIIFFFKGKKRQKYKKITVTGNDDRSMKIEADALTDLENKNDAA